MNTRDVQSIDIYGTNTKHQNLTQYTCSGNPDLRCQMLTCQLGDNKMSYSSVRFVYISHGVGDVQ